MRGPPSESVSEEPSHEDNGEPDGEDSGQDSNERGKVRKTTLIKQFVYLFEPIAIFFLAETFGLDILLPLIKWNKEASNRNPTEIRDIKRGNL